MADDDASAKDLQENPLVATLLAKGADTATRLRGFVGPSARKDAIKLFPRLDNLADSIDIARADVIHSIRAPRSALGAVILWVKKDARLSVRRASLPRENARFAQGADEIRQGRLRMRVPRPDADHLGSLAAFDCYSRCDTCMSVCLCLGPCGSEPE